MSILNDIDKLHRDVMPHIPQGIERAAIDLAFRELRQRVEYIAEHVAVLISELKKGE